MVYLLIIYLNNVSRLCMVQQLLVVSCACNVLDMCVCLDLLGKSSPFQFAEREMSMVRARAENGHVFDIESTWLPILHQRGRLLLPIRSKQTMDDVTHYVKQSDKILRLPKRPRRDEQGRIVRNPTHVATLDARATGVMAIRGITIENQVEAFKRAFVRNRDLASLVEIAQVCNMSNKLTPPTCIYT